MKIAPVLALIPLALTGCASSMYHLAPGRTADMSLYDANRSCLHAVTIPGMEHSSLRTLGAFGAAGGALWVASPEKARLDRETDACMAAHGWTRNE